jgi:hypothetical protein
MSELPGVHSVVAVDSARPYGSQTPDRARDGFQGACRRPQGTAPPVRITGDTVVDASRRAPRYVLRAYGGSRRWLGKRGARPVLCLGARGMTIVNVRLLTEAGTSPDHRADAFRRVAIPADRPLFTAISPGAVAECRACATQESGSALGYSQRSMTSTPAPACHM